jgi:hypothetical protein
MKHDQECSFRDLENSSCGLLPYAIDTNQTAHGTSKTHYPVVEINIAQCRAGYSKVAYVRDQLEVGSSSLPIKLSASSP